MITHWLLLRCFWGLNRSEVAFICVLFFRPVHHRQGLLWSGSDCCSNEGPSDRRDDAGRWSAGVGRPWSLLHRRVWQNDGRRPDSHPRSDGTANHLHCQGRFTLFVMYIIRQQCLVNSSFGFWFILKVCSSDHGYVSWFCRDLIGSTRFWVKRICSEER